MTENNDESFAENFEHAQAKAARKTLIKTIALNTGVAIGTTVLTTVAAFYVGEALKQKAKPMKVVLPQDYAQFYNIAE